MAEVLAPSWAIEELRRTAWNGPVVLEGDSATALAWLAGESGSLMPALRRTRDIMMTSGTFSTMLIPREVNILADLLAHFGKSNRGRNVWSFVNPPPSGLLGGLDPQDFISCIEL